MHLRTFVFFLSALVVATSASAFNFSVSALQGTATGTGTAPTSIQFGPDNRLYVAQVNGQIKILTVQRNAPNNYAVTATETINLVRDIPNYNDTGERNTTLVLRQVTGLLVVGTASSPIIYVTSSDPRIGGGSGGVNDLNLDTNSGIISRLTKVNNVWTKVDLVRGLPRSEENHSTNGMQLDAVANKLYVAQGGNANAGSPSVNFAYMCETALSAAILVVDLAAIDALPVQTDAFGQKFLYNLPTLDDPNPNRAHNPDGSNVNDPFGGNDGLNQAKLVAGGPVQIYSSGYRNPYDIVITRTPGRAGRMYTFDNGANPGWGGYPQGEGTANVTNQYVAGEPGTVNNKDNLHLVTAGFYAGHPDPVRANPAGAGWFRFDESLPSGSQMVYSTNPTSDWPSVPVAMAHPVEGDFRQPGVDDGALLTNGASTNGLTEYVATNFSGAMQGNLIAASYNGNVLRIALTPDGTAVTNGLEILASGFGTLPLDVTAPDPAHGGQFLGTIWVSHYSPAKISILEPADFDNPGGSTCTGINSFDVDEDGDGYSNADELANGTDPCSSAIRPPDWDGDHQSDMLDPDDDDDGINDVQDPFPLDPTNGKSVPTTVHYELFNETGIGFYGVGFTGLMMNRGQDYLPLITNDNAVAGGTAGLFTLSQVGPGTPRGSANAQLDAYQFAYNSNEFSPHFVVTSQLAGPFFNSAPTGNQVQGIYLGYGDQDNYVSLALHANGGAGGVQVVYEVGGVITFEHMYALDDVSTLSTIDLSFEVDPLAGQVQPRYQLPSGPIVPLGSPITVSGDVLMALMGRFPLAIGMFANRGASGTPSFTATWDWFDVAAEPTTAIAKITIDPLSTNMATASTYANDSFKIQNLSTGGQQIETVSFDLRPAILPDLVFDPTGTAGDQVAKPFTPNTVSGGVVLNGGVMTLPHNGTNSNDGYDGVDVNFNAFPVNGLFTFSLDIDPNNVKGVAQPGEHDSASVSGLDLIGTTASVFFSDGSVQRTRVGRVENSVSGSYGWARADSPPKPGIGVVGKTSPFTTGTAQQSVRVSGPAGFNVSLVRAEAGLYLGGVPGGGYNVQPYDANTVVAVSETAAVIPTVGYVDVPVTLTKTDAKSGYNFFTATLADGGGLKGPASDTLEIRYDPSQGGDTQAPTPPGTLSFTSVTSTSITINWTAATDNVAVTGYRISRGATVLATVPDLTYTDSGLTPSTAYTYSVVAVDAAGNASTASTGTVSTVSGTLPTTIRINAGGPSYVDGASHTWAADTGFNTGSTSSTTTTVTGTADPTLYKTERYDTATAPELQYTLGLQNGSYTVRLYFAETFAGTQGAGLRVFDVNIQSQPAFSNVDIFSQAGGSNKALMLSASATVTNSQLTIQFIHKVENPKINAIEIIPATGNDTTPPSTPGSLASSNVTSTSLTLTWAASTDNIGVTGYRVSRNGTLLNTVTTLSFNDTGLAPNTTYAYSVVAIDAAANTSPPATLNVTTTAGADTQPPSAPGPLTFTNITSTAVTLNWTAATDNVGVTGYRISRDGSVITTVNALTYTNTGLSAGINYAYSVVALDADGNVSPASTASVTTTGGSTPGTVRINTGGASFVDPAGNTWAADTGFNTGTTRAYTTTVTGTTNPNLFKTERYDAASAPELLYTLTVPNGSYNVRLYFAETYTPLQGAGLRVFDINLQSQLTFSNVDIFTQAGGGNKALTLSAPATVTNGKLLIQFIHKVENPKINGIELIPVTTDSTPPSTPGSLASSNVTSSSLTLTWDDSTDNVGVTGYRVSRDGTVLNTVTATSFNDTGLSPNTTYAYSVVALDAGGNSSAPATLNVTTATAPDTEPPTTPGGLDSTNVTATSLMLSWTASTDNVGVTGYQVSRNGTALNIVTATSFSDSGLSPNTTYAYSVVALDGAGNASPAATLNVTTAAAPDTQPPTAPGALTFGNVTATSLTVNWTAATDNVGVTNYQVSRNGSVIATINALTFNDSGLTPATTYSYSVVALDAAANASPPSSASIATGSGTSPSAIRVNVGGPTYVDGTGNTWAADNGFNTGLVSTFSGTVSGTTVPQLYKTLRLDDTPAPELLYTFNVPNGTYTVRLLLSETNANLAAVGKRVFDVKIQSQLVFDNVDIFAQAGGLYKALVLEAPAIVTNGQIQIQFIHQVNNPRLNAIEIVPASGGSDTTPPSSPAPLTSTNVTASAATLNWPASTDNVGVTGYRVSRDGVLLTTVPTTSYTDSPLSASTTYAYSVVAVDAAGNTSTPATLNVTTLAAGDTEAPTTPGALAASNVTTTSLTLSWTASTDNVGVTGYRVSRDGTVLSTVTGTSFDDSGLTPATAYAYSVVALDLAGNASTPATANVTTAAAFALRVNAGGSNYVDASNHTWVADTGFNTGLVSTVTGTVSDTPDPQLFKTLRFDDTPSPELMYTFAVPNGTYRVRLHLSETNSTLAAVGKRVFDIRVQSLLAYDNVDVFAQVGYYHALVLETTATVTNGQLQIQFVHQVNNPRVNAIEVLSP